MQEDLIYALAVLVRESPKEVREDVAFPRAGAMCERTMTRWLKSLSRVGVKAGYGIHCEKINGTRWLSLGWVK